MPWKALSEYFGVVQVSKEISVVTKRYGACHLRKNRPNWMENAIRELRLRRKVLLARQLATEHGYIHRRRGQGRLRIIILGGGREGRIECGRGEGGMWLHESVEAKWKRGRGHAGRRQQGTKDEWTRRDEEGGSKEQQCAEGKS